jgi:hypothetical protein
MPLHSKDRKNAPGRISDFDQARPVHERRGLNPTTWKVFGSSRKNSDHNRETHINEFINGRPSEQPPTIPPLSSRRLNPSRGSVPSDLSRASQVSFSKGPMGSCSVGPDDVGSSYGAAPTESFDRRHQNVSPSSTTPLRSQAAQEGWRNNGPLPTSWDARDEPKLHEGVGDQLLFNRREDAMPYAEVDGGSSVLPGSRPYGHGVEVSRRDTYPSNQPVELAGRSSTLNYASRQESTTWQAPLTQRGRLNSHPAGIPTDAGQQLEDGENENSYPVASRGTGTVPYYPPPHGEPRNSSTTPQPNVNGRPSGSRADTWEARASSQQGRNGSYYMSGGPPTQLVQRRSEPNSVEGAAHNRSQYDGGGREVGAEQREHPGPYGSPLYPELAQVCDIIAREVQSTWRTLEQYSHRLEDENADLKKEKADLGTAVAALQGKYSS